MNGTKRQFVIGGKTYIVERHEEWHNDETQVDFFVRLSPSKRIYVGTLEDFWEDTVFPTKLEVAQALAEAGQYTLTPRETLQRDVLTAERELERRQRNAKYSAVSAAEAAKAVATAVQTAEKRALAAQLEAEKAQQALAEAEVRYADLQVQLQNLKD